MQLLSKRNVFDEKITYKYDYFLGISKSIKIVMCIELDTHFDVDCGELRQKE